MHGSENQYLLNTPDTMPGEESESVSHLVVPDSMTLWTVAPLDSSVHGILQVSMLGWVAMYKDDSKKYINAKNLVALPTQWT